MIGMVIFTTGSLACALSSSGTALILFRAYQGLGAAIVSPATLAIISAAFRHGGAERNKAFGIWGAVAGSGAAAGVLLGGILVEYFGWEWIFLVNVPVGIAIFALAPWLISEGRVEGADRHTDPVAAVLVTSGLVSFVYAMSKAPDNGWTSAKTIGFTALAVVLIAAFFWRELRTDAPLVPLWIFRMRPVFVANTVGALLGGAIFGGFFLLTLYMQQVLGYSPLKAGLAFLATAGTTIPAAAVSQALVTRIGVKPVMTFGLFCMSFSYLWFTQLPPDGRVLDEPVHPVLHQRDRPRVHLHPALVVGAVGRRRPDRGRVVGPAEHLAADRRRSGRGDHVHHLDDAHRDAGGRRGHQYPTRSPQASTGPSGSRRASCSSARW